MKQGEVMASIITKLKNKQQKYTVESIINAVLPDQHEEDEREIVTDIIFQLSRISVLKEVIDNDLISYFTLSVFYRQHLNAAPQTASIKLCYQALFPNGYQKAEQITMFHEAN